jgi:phenylpropionate dioxygenase-like ring-hydroxylating dioxygenase large terminal subunit
VNKGISPDRAGRKPGGKATVPANWEPGRHKLRDAWFPVAHTPILGAKPVRRHVHSQPYYIVRQGDRFRAFEFHPRELKRRRGEAGEFTGGSGEYPLMERYGFAWVWYGNPDNADPDLIPDIPFLSPRRAAPAYARVGNFFHCTYELVLENILDLTHIDFIHGNYAGTHESEDDRISVESTSETITMIRTIRKKPTSQYQKNVLGIREKFQDVTNVTHVFIRSGVCFLHAHYSAAPSMPLMQNNTPESPFLTRADAVFGVEQCADPLYRRAWPKTGPMVAAQDETMLRPQNPRYLLERPCADNNSRFDTAGLLYRRRHQALVERQQRGDLSYQSDIADAAGIGDILRIKRMT